MDNTIMTTAAIAVLGSITGCIMCVKTWSSLNKAVGIRFSLPWATLAPIPITKVFYLVVLSFARKSQLTHAPNSWVIGAGVAFAFVAIMQAAVGSRFVERERLNENRLAVISNDDDVRKEQGEILLRLGNCLAVLGLCESLAVIAMVGVIIGGNIVSQ